MGHIIKVQWPVSSAPISGLKYTTDYTMSKQSFVNLDLSLDETDINGWAIQILNVIRPAWKPTDIKFKVSIFNHIIKVERPVSSAPVSGLYHRPLLAACK
jgi:hypothetical protein